MRCDILEDIAIFGELGHMSCGFLVQYKLVGAMRSDILEDIAIFRKLGLVSRECVVQYK